MCQYEFFMSTTPTRDQGKFIVRMPDGMRDRLKDEAENSGRSMNSEIVSRIALTLEENVWERQKFIDMLNFKQHTLDMTLHMMFAAVGKQKTLEAQAQYERALRVSLLALNNALCEAILQSESAPEHLAALAKDIKARSAEIDVTDNFEVDKEQIRRGIGDKDIVETGFEENLSDDAKAKMAESRKWAAPYK